MSSDLQVTLCVGLSFLDGCTDIARRETTRATIEVGIFILRWLMNDGAP